MNSKIAINALFVALILAVNCYYRIVVNAVLFLVLSLVHVVLLVNLAVMLKDRVSTGFVYALCINLALNIMYSLLDMFNMIMLMDVFTATLLLIVIIITVSRGRADYLSIHIPIAMVIGVFTGIIIGVKYPLRYSILGLLDISLSRLIEGGGRKEVLFTKILIAIALYTSPIYFVSISVYLYNLLLFTPKAFMVNGKRGLITGSDIVFKPIIYWLRPWI